MKDNIIFAPKRFKETQAFKKQWYLLISVVAVGVYFYLFLINKKELGFAPSTEALITVAVFGGVMISVFSRLETEIDENAIQARFIPFQWRTKIFCWHEIEHVEVGPYHPIRQFGGWGIRWSFKSGRAFTVRGKQGIHITLKTGKKVTIGTQKPKLAKAVIARHFETAGQLG